jgi:hypothetical protein
LRIFGSADARAPGPTPPSLLFTIRLSAVRIAGRAAN